MGDLSVIQGKIRIPSIADRFVPRPRLDALVSRSVAEERVVVVSASAGAGKTTAVVAGLRELARPIAWLTLDKTDTAPGRLVTYLEAALVRQLPELEGISARALAALVPHAETAGLLADSIGDAPLVLVLDGLERLGDRVEAWDVVEAVIRHAPPALRVVLISRREIPTHLCELPGPGDVAHIGDEGLLFTEDEAAAVLERLGRSEVSPQDAVTSTGGWVTGVLFEAWRSDEHVSGAGGEADPLNGYLSSHILRGLGQEDRDFLVRTSILDEVTVRRAAALGLARPGERLAALRAAHLPVSWELDGGMRCHPRVREYLLERLDLADEAEVRTLRLAYANMLASEGHAEDAAEELLRIGALAEAVPMAERAIVGVIERLDHAIAERWLAALVDVAPASAPRLTTAELMLALAKDDVRRAVRIADQLQELGEREPLARASPTAAALITWAYLHVGRIADSQSVLAVADQDDPLVRVARSVSRAAAGVEPDAPAPQRTGGPIDALALIAAYLFGQLQELAEPAESEWADAVGRPWRAAALRALGRTDEALELYERGPRAGLGFDVFVGPEVLLDAGRIDEAREAARRGWVLADANGSYALQVLNVECQVKIALRVDRDTAAARAALGLGITADAAEQFIWVSDVWNMWHGFACLLDGEDAEALQRLRLAVNGMTNADRILELATAAVYLAEAEWRAGNDAAADEAADVALDAARRQGSRHLLLQAIRDFPAVLSRRMDAEPATDSAWHAIGRALTAQRAGTSGQTFEVLHLRDFGPPALMVDAEPRRPRIAKSLELLAYLVAHRGEVIPRPMLIDLLFEGRDDESTRAYLRQAIRQLKLVLPEGSGLTVGDGTIMLEVGAPLSSDASRFGASVSAAALLVGSARLKATTDALVLYDRGEYLEGLTSSWVDAERRTLRALAGTARYEAAQIAYDEGDYAGATDLIERALENDPTREEAWRLRMRIAGAVGDEHGVIAAFRRCEAALSELPTTPARTTLQLLETLRR
ncbi:HTH-type transcriptional regulator MalT [Paraconexibacter sp. AEG42_29]|uniref:HTH-type transcriptional regulator MalT n=1 Tax=Paraconexibacter sp. AEG42_29 TaxID=2997339 RepID=A0AAU7B0H3_9ACTN